MLRQFGAPESEISAAAAEAPQPIEILLENKNAMDAFFVASSQWRLGPTGLPYGLDYTAADVAWRYSGIELSPDDFWRLRYVESEALQAMAVARK